jgi:ribosomal protein S27AE
MLTVNFRRTSWKELYELQTITFALFVFFLPTVGLAVQLFGSSALIPAASLYGGVLLFVQRKAIDWKCPHCGKPFLRSHGNGFALPFRNHCGACGTRRGR